MVSIAGLDISGNQRIRVAAKDISNTGFNLVA